MKTQIKSIEINVYVIEPNVLMRQMLSGMVRNEEGLMLAGTSAFTGQKSAISSIRKQEPDVLMLGIVHEQSEEMKLLDTLREEFPLLPIILLTPLTDEGAKIAIVGLMKGAVDFITKPDQKQGPLFAKNHFEKRVLPTLKAVPRLNMRQFNPKQTFSSQISSDYTGNSVLPFGSGRIINNNVGLISINGCLGAVPGHFQLISDLPSDLSVPVVVIQHMPKIYTAELARQLDLVTPLHVREAKNGSILLPGQIYIIPGGYHAVVRNEGNRRVIRLHRGPREHKSRPSFDVLLRSAVQAYNGKMLGVFLSGGGNDGISGAKNVIDSGGYIIIENDQTALLGDIGSKLTKLTPQPEKLSIDSMAKKIRNLLIVKNKPRIHRAIQDSSAGNEIYF